MRKRDRVPCLLCLSSYSGPRLQYDMSIQNTRWSLEEMPRDPVSLTSLLGPAYYSAFSIPPPSGIYGARPHSTTSTPPAFPLNTSICREGR